MCRQTPIRRRFTYFRTLAVLTCIVLAMCLDSGHSGFAEPNSKPATANEANLMLARMYATAKFISWPDEASAAGSPFVIGVIEPSPFGEGLGKLAEKKIKDRPIQVRRYKSLADYTPCHLLFIPDAIPAETTRDFLDLSSNAAVLVWRESPDSATGPGIACTFVKQDDGLYIEADPFELKRRGLWPDGRLLNLNLVRVVKPGK
jgi:hypothetical protein